MNVPQGSGLVDQRTTIGVAGRQHDVATQPVYRPVIGQLSVNVCRSTLPRIYVQHPVGGNDKRGAAIDGAADPVQRGSQRANDVPARQIHLPGPLEYSRRRDHKVARGKIDCRVGGRLHHAAKAAAVLQIDCTALGQETAAVGERHRDVGGTEVGGLLHRAKVSEIVIGAQNTARVSQRSVALNVPQGSGLVDQRTTVGIARIQHDVATQPVYRPVIGQLSVNVCRSTLPRIYVQHPVGGNDKRGAAIDGAADPVQRGSQRANDVPARQIHLPGPLDYSRRRDHKVARGKIDCCVGGRLHHAAKAAAALQIDCTALGQETAAVGKRHRDVGGTEVGGLLNRAKVSEIVIGAQTTARVTQRSVALNVPQGSGLVDQRTTVGVARIQQDVATQPVDRPVIGQRSVNVCCSTLPRINVQHPVGGNDKRGAAIDGAADPVQRGSQRANDVPARQIHLPGPLEYSRRRDHKVARGKIDCRVGGRLHHAAKAAAVLQIDCTALGQETAAVGERHRDVGGTEVGGLLNRAKVSEIVIGAQTTARVSQRSVALNVPQGSGLVDQRTTVGIARIQHDVATQPVYRPVIGQRSVNVCRSTLPRINVQHPV